MREFPQGGIIGKAVGLWRSLSGLRVPLYAANASFFMMLAVFPGLLLLLGLLVHSPSSKLVPPGHSRSAALFRVP